MILPPYRQKPNCVAMPTVLPSSQRHFITSYHHRKRRGAQTTIRYLERARDTTVTELLSQCCSILLLVIVANLLLHLIYKLSFIKGMCGQEKEHSVYRVHYYSQFQVSTGGLIPEDKGGLLFCVKVSFKITGSVVHILSENCPSWPLMKTRQKSWCRQNYTFILTQFRKLDLNQV